MMDYNVLKKRLNDLVHVNKGKKFIIYPMGMQGALVKGILNGQMGIEEAYILDNRLCNQCDWIYPVSILGKLCREDYLVLVACKHPRYSEEIMESLKQYNFEYCDVCYGMELGPGGYIV